ncbi:acyl carrier protein [Spirillospora sp. CA-294931]|uniref:acyl carrier protein n=1 Tax=Spirillospora sp. CA-294931 TaxID=3240042 RepID=UPI003D8D21F2
MNTTEITLTDLVATLRECAGEEESVDLDGAIDDRTFADLGYDSIALLETHARLADRHDLTLDDSELAELHTPAELLRYLNGVLAKGA